MNCYIDAPFLTKSDLYRKRSGQAYHEKWNTRNAEKYLVERTRNVCGRAADGYVLCKSLPETKEIVFASYYNNETLFRKYAEAWYTDIANDPTSSLTRITSGNENYLKVISLGVSVIPLILRELESNCAPWFLALRILTDNSEIGTQQAGNFGKIADAWLEWGKVNGHLAS